MSVLEFIKVVILGIVEGITEWLPISSTGHMILVDEFIKMDMTTEFKDFFLVVIQLGAILAVVVLYWSKLWPFYIRQIPKKKKAQIARKNPFSRIVLTFVEKFCDKDKWILWFKILVACIPTIVIALPFNDYIEEKFNNYVVVAIALIVYGVIFIIIENYNKRRKPICTSLEDLSFATAFKIGIFQVLSVPFRFHDYWRYPCWYFKNGCSRIYLFSGNSGYVRSESAETGKIRLHIHSGRGSYTGHRRCGCIFCFYYRHQIPDGIY